MRIATLAALLLLAGAPASADETGPDFILPPEENPGAAARAPAAAATPVSVPDAAPTASAVSVRGYAAFWLGGLLPQPFNRLGASVQPRLAGTYFLPVLDGRIGAGLALEYVQPSLTRTVSDPRVPGGSYTFTLVERDLRIGLGAQYHFLAPGGDLSPYAGARLRVHLLEAEVVGSAAGRPLGGQHEQGTTAGGAAFGGVLYRLGPGVLAAELELDLAGVDHLVPGDRNLSALSLLVGYGLTF